MHESDFHERYLGPLKVEGRERLERNLRKNSYEPRALSHVKRTFGKLALYNDIFSKMNFLRQFEDKEGFEYIEDEIDLDVKAVFELYKAEVVF